MLSCVKLYTFVQDKFHLIVFCNKVVDTVLNSCGTRMIVLIIIGIFDRAWIHHVTGFLVFLFIEYQLLYDIVLVYQGRKKIYSRRF